MCGTCFILWAKDFLIVSGSVAMIFLIVILCMIVGLLWRVRSGLVKIEQISMQIQSLGNLPMQFFERWLQTKKGSGQK